MHSKQDKLKEIETTTHHNQSKAKNKERMLKPAKEKQLITCKGCSIRKTVGFSSASQKPKDSRVIYSECYKKNCKPTILYVAKMSFKSERN